MGKKTINENYFHERGSKRENLSKYQRSLSMMNYSKDELVEIYSFYLDHAPVLKTSSQQSFGLKKLLDYRCNITPEINM